jgi:hypothetical protein
MSCDACGTINRYGKRVRGGRRICIDCWRNKKEEEEKKNEKKKDQ